MSYKPLRNSQGVNKPFRSPLTSSDTPRDRNVKSNSNTPESSTRRSKLSNKRFRSPLINVRTSENANHNDNANTPESARETQPKAATSKRLLFERTPAAKRLRVSDENEADEVKSNEGQTLLRRDLNALKRRISEKQEAISSLKTKLMYKRKNKAEDLEAAIEKWTEACQNALRDYQNVLQEKCGYSVTTKEILSSLGIDQSVVRFSTDDNTFY